LLKIFI
jgi:hypothetical protein